MIYFPILGALALGIGTILQKLVLKKEKINIRLYHVLEFSAIVIAMLPIIYFFWKLDPQALELKNLFIFSLVIVFNNCKYFYFLLNEMGKSKQSRTCKSS